MTHLPQRIDISQSSGLHENIPDGGGFHRTGNYGKTGGVGGKLAQKAVIDAAKQDGLLLKVPAKGFVPVSKLLDIPAMKNLYMKF